MTSKEFPLPVTAFSGVSVCPDWIPAQPTMDVRLSSGATHKGITAFGSNGGAIVDKVLVNGQGMPCHGIIINMGEARND
jgi:hypothetical protein